MIAAGDAPLPDQLMIKFNGAYDMLTLLVSQYIYMYATHYWVTIGLHNALLPNTNLLKTTLKFNH